MRLLNLNDRLSARGGADWHLLGVLSSLVADHDVHLAVGFDDATAKAPCSITVVPGLDARTRTTVDLEAVIDSFQPDLVHVHNIVNPAVLEWAADRRALMTVQDHRAFCPTRGKWTSAGEVCRAPMEREICAGCFTDSDYFDQIFALTETRRTAMRRMPLVVLSSYMKRELVEVGVAADRVHVIPPFVHGLDLEAEPDGPPCVLFVGRLVEAKGVADAIEAWRRMRVDLPLVVAGTGRLRQRLDSDVQVLGWVPHEQLAAVYRRAQVLLMPSRWQEPFGIVGLEALALGVPVAAWDSGGVAEWHAAPVTWGDVEALAEHARALLGTRASRASGFERAPLMEQLVALYRHL